MLVPITCVTLKIFACFSSDERTNVKEGVRKQIKSIVAVMIGICGEHRVQFFLTTGYGIHGGRSRSKPGSEPCLEFYLEPSARR